MVNETKVKWMTKAAMVKKKEEKRHVHHQPFLWR